MSENEFKTYERQTKVKKIKGMMFESEGMHVV